MQMLCHFASREAFLDACPPAWTLDPGPPVPPPELGALVVLGVLRDQPETTYSVEGAPLVPPVDRPGYYVLAAWRGTPPEAFAAAEIARQPGDPLIPGEDAPAPELPLEAVPLEISRASARVVMAAHILPDGRSLLRAMRELLAAQQEATAGLPDADPRRIAAAQAFEWWTAAAVYRHDHPVLRQAALVLGLPDATVDALFRAADAIKDS